MKMLYIDTETTGLDPKESAIIQLSGIIVADGKEEEFNFNMSPHDGAIFTEFSISKHNVTPEKAEGFPKPEVVFSQFIALMDTYIDKWDKEDKFIVVGYNVIFDTDFLRAWFERNGHKYFGSYFWHPPLDVFQYAAFKYIGQRHLLPNFQLTTVYEYATGKSLEGAHDALADVRATRELLNVLYSTN